MKKQTKRIVWTKKKSCSLLRQHNPPSPKPKRMRLHVFPSDCLSLKVKHTEHTQADKRNKNLNERKQTVIKERIQKNKNHLAMTNKAQQIQGWCLWLFFRREFDRAFGKTRDPPAFVLYFHVPISLFCQTKEEKPAMGAREPGAKLLGGR